jgi:hypothetical protein
VVEKRMTTRQRTENEIAATIMATEQAAASANGIAEPTERGHSNVMIDRMEAMLADDDYRDDDCLSPTSIAIKIARRLFSDAARSVEFALPAGSVLPDGDGGIRCRWVSGNREIRVVIHGDKESKSYLYHQQGNEYDVEHPLSSNILVKWLRWLKHGG